MRLKLFVAAALAGLLCLGTASALASKTKRYYLALGDSLARGAQPNASGTTVPTNRGYTNDLFASEKPEFPTATLTLKELGCLGESTTTMLHGGICKYAAGSQENAAVDFLKAHKGHIAFVTIDIGANDVDNCVTGSTINYTCVGKGVAAINKNLPKIAKRLRMAAGNDVPIIGMTYYDPFLAEWFKGSSGKSTAMTTQTAAKSVNGDITNDYKSNGVKKVADVATAFETYAPFTQTKKYKGKQVPVAVVKICKLTWMCAPKPKGPNIHGNDAGYAKIAKVFDKLA